MTTVNESAQMRWSLVKSKGIRMANVESGITRRSFLSLLGVAGLSLVGSAALVGCAQGESELTQAPSAQEPENLSSSSALADAFGAGSALVAYFSAQGHTERVANDLSSALGAPTFKVTPIDSYTADDLAYNTPTNRTGREHDDESLRDIELVQTTPDNWDSYSVVFVGYPIWWDIAAWPINRFVSDNDFTGKTVIPFCTSASSPIGESGMLLAELAGTGTWGEGKRFSSSASSDEAEEWAASLGLATSNSNQAISLEMGGVTLTGALNASAEASQFAAMLPCTISMVRYGDREYYGNIDSLINTDQEGNYTFEDGDITYCPTNNSVAIFFSQSTQPNLAMGVIPIGKVTSDLAVFNDIGNRAEARFSAQ